MRNAERVKVVRTNVAAGPPWTWSHWCGMGRFTSPGRYWKWADAFRGGSDHAERCCR